MRIARANRPPECEELTPADPVNADSWPPPAPRMRVADAYRLFECV